MPVARLERYSAASSVWLDGRLASSRVVRTFRRENEKVIRLGGGLLVTPGSTVEMAEGFSRLLKDDSLRQQFTKSGLERARDFDLQAHVDRMIKIFEDCVKK